MLLSMAAKEKAKAAKQRRSESPGAEDVPAPAPIAGFEDDENNAELKAVEKEVRGAHTHRMQRAAPGPVCREAVRPSACKCACLRSNQPAQYARSVAVAVRWPYMY